jgi:CheY-like chemotaxis protein
MAGSHRSDVICLDLQMPDIGGAEVLRLLREDPDTRDIPVVVVTGAPLDDAGRRRLSELSAHVLTKDAVSRERVLAAVDAAMRTPAGAA